MEARSQKGTTYNIVKGGREIKPKIGEIRTAKSFRKVLALGGLAWLLVALLRYNTSLGDK